MARIGVDVGGTNTDLVLECGKGVFYHKVPTTLKNQSIGVVEGVKTLCRKAEIEPAEVEMIVHGTTTATNITIEHNGSECGMLTTEGFRDILHIGRHKRPYNFSLHFDVPWQSQPLVKRRNRIAIPSASCRRPARSRRRSTRRRCARPARSSGGAGSSRW